MHSTSHFKNVLIELRRNATSQSHSYDYVLNRIEQRNNNATSNY